MGRVKLQIKKIENTNGRIQSTYTKRKNGIMKKANELSILCDVNIILLMFSPTGKPSLCKGMHSPGPLISTSATTSNVRVSALWLIATNWSRYLLFFSCYPFEQHRRRDRQVRAINAQERAKRKLESLEALKKTFKKLDHDVNIPEFLGTSSQAVEELSDRSQLLQAQLSHVQQRLSCWTKIEKIDSVDQLGHLESSIKESLGLIRAQKEKIEKQQLMPLDYNSQFQRGIHFPFKLGAEQQLSPPTSWIPSNDGQQMVFSDDPNQIPQRDCEGSGSSSFGSYLGFFCTDRGSDQLSRQYQYAPYAYQNSQNGNKFQLPAADMNLHQQYNAAPFQANEGKFDAPKFGFDSTSCNWGSGSGLYPATMFDAHLYARQPN